VNENKQSPAGMNVTPEAKKEQRKALDLNPTHEGATKIRDSIKFGAIAVGIVVLMAIVVGVVTHGPGKAKKEKGGKDAPIQTAGATGTKGIDDMLAMAQGREKGFGHSGWGTSNGKQSGSEGGGQMDADGNPIPKGDVAGELGLPPTRIVPGRSGSSGTASAGGPRQLSPAELAAIDAAAEDKLARTSSMTSKGGSSQSKGLLGAALNPEAGLGDGISRLASLASANQGLAGAGAGAGAGGGDDPNQQGDKTSFLSKAHVPTEPTSVPVSIIPSQGPFEIKAGWDIPATLEQRMDSDLPGDVRGIVRENVYDSATGRYLLIPQGSRVIGTYNSRVSYGQSGMQVVWTRLIYPNGSSIDLGGLNGQDVSGISGFRDKVDNHYVRLVGFALMTSAFSAGIELSQNTSASTSTFITPQQAATQAVGQQLGELGEEITRKNLNIQPTIKISIGYRFTIRVRRDLVFDRPYRAS
jgi:type IV secretory pathway VirB10-like protein